MKKILISFILVSVFAILAPARETVRILAIGNSFSEDAVEQNLHEIAAADGIDLIIGNMYIGGCTIDRHVGNVRSDSDDYAYRKIGVNGVKKETAHYRLSQAIKDEKWDYVSVQQASGVSGVFESYAQLPELVAWVRENAPGAEVVFHQTWAYASDSQHPEFPNYDRDQRKMTEMIKFASTRNARKARINTIIPCLEAIRIARESNPETSITRDGYHLDKRFGRYVAAATWYATLSGKRVSGNSYCPEKVTEKELKSAQRAADAAVFGWGPAKVVPGVIEPGTQSGLYEGHKNYGKSIAVFGGSLSVNRESNAAKQIWADELHSTVTTYGVGGAGFARGQGFDLQKQVDMAGVHDIYVLWASTNDFTNSQDIGTWSDYTDIDGFDEFARYTQCGGINYCIKTLLEKNPDAQIYFFTSLRFFSREEGHNPFSERSNSAGGNFAAYVAGQKACCEYFCIPVLDQFNLQGVNEYNYKRFYLNDSLHMNEDGYRRIGPVQAAFLADGK